MAIVRLCLCVSLCVFVCWVHVKLHVGKVCEIAPKSNASQVHQFSSLGMSGYVCVWIQQQPTANSHGTQTCPPTPGRSPVAIPPPQWRVHLVLPAEHCDAPASGLHLPPQTSPPWTSAPGLPGIEEDQKDHVNCQYNITQPIWPMTDTSKSGHVTPFLY